MSAHFSKHDKIRIEQWTRKLCQVTNNREWKRNRNLYATWLLDMVLNKHLEKPFTKVPPEGNQLDTLQPSEIRARLSSKVFQLLQRKERSAERRVGDNSERRLNDSSNH